ncbi:MAG: hypothetical protein JWR80_6843 [Bradyrhizobium sp.]|nr:hypothetical protein [Bradyrhizobium sp.]
MTDRPPSPERQDDPAAMGRFRPRSLHGCALALSALLAGSLAVVALHRTAGPDSHYAVEPGGEGALVSAGDPLLAELRRCAAQSPVTDDPACRRAWDANRRHFFGDAGEPVEPLTPAPVSVPAPAMEH